MNFFADALETVCHAFNWSRYSVVVSDDEEEMFYLLRQEITRRGRLQTSNITVSMIREFSTDTTILANHDESYANNVSIIVIIAKAKEVARFIKVSTQERDDRAQYVWVRVGWVAGLRLDTFSLTSSKFALFISYLLLLPTRRLKSLRLRSRRPSLTMAEFWPLSTTRAMTLLIQLCTI